MRAMRRSPPEMLQRPTVIYRPCLLYLLIVRQRLNAGEHRTGLGGLLRQSSPSSDEDELHTEQRIDDTSVDTDYTRLYITRTH